jgi:hypothetical protein
MRPKSRSVTDVQFPVPYDDRSDDQLWERLDTRPLPPARILTTDPWFPRNDLPNGIMRLGSIINPKAFEDDITNYAINGAYQ